MSGMSIAQKSMLKRRGFKMFKMYRPIQGNAGQCHSLSYAITRSAS